MNCEPIQGVLMRRSRALTVVLVVVFASALASGCAGLTGGGSKATRPPAATPAVGTQGFPSFLPLSATTFSDGIGALGFDVEGPDGKKTIATAITQPADATTWNTSRVGTEPRYPNAATNVGTTAVMVGDTPAGSPGSRQVPFVAVNTLADGGAFQFLDTTQLFGGKSAEINDVARTGDAKATDTKFIMVGATVKAQDSELGNPYNTIPVAFTSSDGKSWERSGELPLPDGVAAAEAFSVTYAPAGTAFPGVLVVGSGWAADPTITRRDVAIVWQSTDGGRTWKVVSDEAFDQEGRNLSSRFIAADARTIVVAGFGDVQGTKNNQVTAIDWTVGADGTWGRVVDTLKADRSSITTALIARPGGGFLTTSEVHDRGTAATKAGQELQGNPVASAYSSENGVDWTAQTPNITDMQNAVVIMGISEYGGRAAFFGMDNKSISRAYIVDSASLK
jgi:hypothetical protein